MIEVVAWVSYTDSDLLGEAIGSFGGDFEVRYTRRSYLDTWKLAEDRAYIEAIWRALDRLAPIIITGDAHHSARVPVFSDGTTARFSMRGWGDLVSAWWNDRHPNCTANYCAFAWLGSRSDGCEDEREMVERLRPASLLNLIFGPLFGA